jgi:hypothetical protein
VPIKSSDPEEATVSPGTLIFTPADWDQLQSVSVVGSDDRLLDGDIDYHVDIGPSASADADFDGLTQPGLAGVNEDDEVAALRVAPAAGLATAGEGSGARFRVSLAAEPLEPVTLSADSSHPHWGEVADAEIVLDSSNWQTGSDVLVVGRDDPTTTVDVHAYQVEVTVASGGEAWMAADAETVDLIHRAGDTWGITGGRIALPAVVSGSGFWRYDFEYPFEQVPVVVLVGDDGERNPASVRIRNVDERGFELVQVQPPAVFGRSNETEVHFLAVAPGAYPLAGGGAVEAGRTQLSNRVDVDDPFDWQRIEFGWAFGTTPAVLTSLQSMVNETADVPQTASEPWLTVAVSDVDAAGFAAALERSSVSSGAIGSPETIGWVAWQGALGEFASGSGWVEWQGRPGDIAAPPWSAGCNSSAALGALFDLPIVVTGLHSRANSAGGWLRLCNRTDGAMGVIVDQDVELDDTRGLQPENVGAVVFDRGFHTRLQSRPQLVFEDDFESE